MSLGFSIFFFAFFRKIPLFLPSSPKKRCNQQQQQQQQHFFT